MENFENNEPTKEEIREQAINNILGAKRALNNFSELKEYIKDLENKIEETLKE